MITKPNRLAKLLQIVALFILAALMATVSTTRAAEAQDDDSPQDLSEEVEILGLDSHPNGAQAIVTSVTVTRDATKVEGVFINGRDFPITIRLDTEDTQLRDDRGRTYELLGTGPREDLEQGGSATFVLQFAPISLSRVDSLTIELNAREDDDQDLDERSPGFRIEDVDPTGTRVAPGLPSLFPIGERVVHPTGLSLEIRGISFANRSIGLSYISTNTAIGRRALSQGHHASFLEDDLGNRYNLKFEGSGRTLAVDSESTREGVLVFGGRIAPGATALRLILNSDESQTDSRALNPKFDMGPWIFEADAGDGFEPVVIDEEQVHPNDVSITVTDFTFGDAGTLVTVNVENPRRTSVLLNPCCRSTYLEDDLGNRYLLDPFEDNASFRVERDRGIDAILSFPGAIDPRATSIELYFGNREDATSADRLASDAFRPFFHFGPYELERAPGAENSRSSGALDAVVVDDGVLLTVPSSLLFNEDGDEVAGSAEGVIDAILDFLDNYEGDELAIFAHTDNEGRSFDNLNLSIDQAAAVRQALIDGGISRQLITAVGRGEADAVAANTSSEGRAANNRVEIMIFTTNGLPN